TGARSNELEDPEPTQFTDEEFAAMVDEAHRLGCKVSAHAEGLPGCRAAVNHGMDTIEHGMYLNQEPELIDKMVQGGQFLMPTITGYYWMSGFGPEVIDTEGLEPGDGLMPMLKELALYNLEQGTESMRACRDAGVTIC